VSLFSLHSVCSIWNTLEWKLCLRKIQTEALPPEPMQSGCRHEKIAHPQELKSKGNLRR
jgi:hypothetical protein